MSLLARFGSGRPRAPLELVLYTRPGCHLCDEMKAVIAGALRGVEHTLAEVDVDGDPELARRHGLSIPVLAIDGRIAFKGRLTAAELLRKVSRPRSARGR